MSKVGDFFRFGRIRFCFQYFYRCAKQTGITDPDMHMPFYEHVLLDRYLDDFPQHQVVQNFMKLVLNGLSQNAYLSVNEKKEAITWYKNFFENNLDDLKDAMDKEKQQQEELSS